MTDTAVPASTTMHDLTLPPLPRSTGSSVGLEDRLDLLELEARFNYCIDSRDYEGLRDLATEDVVMLHPWGDAEGVTRSSSSSGTTTRTRTAFGTSTSTRSSSRGRS